MHIILNSDVIHTNRPFAKGLPKHIETFCRNAAAVGAVLVIPKTVLLEDERHQTDLVEEHIRRIENSLELLRSWSVEMPLIDVRKAIPRMDLLRALQATGIKVEVVDPILEDYQDAERRACLRIAPASPTAESDEMRDLVIWAVAIRIAQKVGRAMLVTRDNIHSHQRGANEAAEKGLVRAKSFDEALDLLGHETPGAALARSILSSVWSLLKQSSLPIPDAANVRKFSKLRFSSDEAGRVNADLDFQIDGPKGTLSGIMSILQTTPINARIALTNLQLNDKEWEGGTLVIEGRGVLPLVAKPATDRLSNLRTLLQS